MNLEELADNLDELKKLMPELEYVLGAIDTSDEDETVEVLVLEIDDVDYMLTLEFMAAGEKYVHLINEENAFDFLFARVVYEDGEELFEIIEDEDEIELINAYAMRHLLSMAKENKKIETKIVDGTERMAIETEEN